MVNSTENHQNESYWFTPGEETSVCRNASYWPSGCPNGYTCLPDMGPNPNNGITNFDSIMWSMITVFQMFTLDYWEDVYNMVLRAAGLSHFVYFLLVMLLGPFYMLNLLLAIVALAYNEAMKNQEIIQQAKVTFQKKYKQQIDNCKMVKLNSVKPNLIAVSVHKFGKWLNNTRKDFTCKKYAPELARITDFSEKLVNFKIFGHFITVCIALNTLCLAAEHDGSSENFDKVLKILNDIFTWIFFTELMFKIMAQGFITCLLKPADFFDFIIVVIGLYDFFSSLNGSSSSGLTVIRSLRLLRVFKLAQKWKAMRKLLATIRKSLSAVGYLVIVLFVILFIFAVLSKSLLSGDYLQFYDDYFNDTSTHKNDIASNMAPRWNMNNSLSSFVLVFRVLCGEWIEPLFDCWKITDGNGVCVALFISITLIANFLVFNLFIAILLDAVAAGNSEDLEEKKLKRNSTLDNDLEKDEKVKKLKSWTMMIRRQT